MPRLDKEGLDLLEVTFLLVRKCCRRTHRSESVQKRLWNIHTSKICQNKCFRSTSELSDVATCHSALFTSVFSLFVTIFQWAIIIILVMRVILYELMNSVSEKVVGPFLRKTGKQLYAAGNSL